MRPFIVAIDGPAGAGKSTVSRLLARRLGFRIAEVPVTWRNDAASHVNLWSGFRAFPDLLRIRANAWTGRYAVSSGPERQV